jgi:glutathione S-transferase
MPKLYYTATSCGAASFISAFTAGVALDSEQVDIRSHVTSSGVDFYTINPKGNVPALVLEDGSVLNENIAVQLWIADQKPGTIAPAPGTPERSVLLNALSYVATEVHPAVGCFFMPNAAADVTAFFRTRVNQKLTYLNDKFIGDRQFIVGDSFTVVDSYLYIVLSWTQYVGIDLSEYPKVQAYFNGIAALENVKNAHARIAENPATVL